jgi:hypothetical protein
MKLIEIQTYRVKGVNSLVPFLSLRINTEHITAIEDMPTASWKRIRMSNGDDYIVMAEDVERL